MSEENYNSFALVDRIFKLENTVERLKRENAILRSELKHRISSDIIFTETDRDMTKEQADAQAEKEITWMIAHNEGAE